MPASPNPRPVLALDASSLFYRAFFALPRTLRDPSGRPVNAVRGYLDMAAGLLRQHQPRRLVNVLDADWRPAWRVAAYPGYKAHRPEDPPELPGQLPVLREVLDAAGLPVAAAAGYEADDVLGTMAAACGAGDRLEVVTGDRDLFQLVRDPQVAVLYPVRGVSQLTCMDEAAVRARCGVPPDRYADLAILRGDPSDGLPGVPGVGEKTAARLLTEHGSLDGVLAARDRLPPRIAAALDASRDYLAAMRVVVPVATGVPYEVTPARPPNRDRLAQLAEEHGLGGPARRLLAAIEAAGLE